MKRYRTNIKIKLMWHDAVLLSVWLEDIKLNREHQDLYLYNTQKAEQLERVLDTALWGKAYAERRGK